MRSSGQRGQSAAGGGRRRGRKRYRQFLTSYKSVTIAAMASAFGVGPDFIDTEIAAFIASGQIACKIDKVPAPSYVRLYKNISEKTRKHKLAWETNKKSGRKNKEESLAQ